MAKSSTYQYNGEMVKRRKNVKIPNSEYSKTMQLGGWMDM